MACINRQGARAAPPPISPRISFSNDFVLEPTPTRSTAPPDPNFEFAVGIRPMVSADELFFQGRMLPLAHPYPPSATSARVTTLRDELRAGEDDGEDDNWAPPKEPVSHKKRHALRRAYSGLSGRKKENGSNG
ncbi:hypothetical protein HPP92_004231 [Vanilla planifolia]|uniref:Uncharacterized protein n=1 Tax=Vanilla planifolia TaxID=51239 RepID=A0A835VJP6_VANPL|nr:hypothetical protein HPP92_004231 [Vanilla planifolia]